VRALWKWGRNGKEEKKKRKQVAVKDYPMSYNYHYADQRKTRRSIELVTQMQNVGGKGGKDKGNTSPSGSLLTKRRGRGMLQFDLQTYWQDVRKRRGAGGRRGGRPVR